ncbi:MAG: TonB-dependent receptor [Salinivirgaceae bacterium]|jgi:TonB-linked SusC/RagA family outer membrane protein|nr:TonB-dependent receptor [Salinivirgaceae bacterium]
MIKKLTLFASMLIGFGVMAFSQSLTVNGKITDKEGNPLVGATVTVKGTTTGTIADIDGNYVLDIKANEATLVYSFIGYTNQEIPVNNQSVINVVMESDITDIDEVVVVGYGTQKKSVVTGAIAKVDQDILEKSSTTRIEQALQGQTAGVVVLNNSGQPGDNLTVRIRGVGTVKDADPLFIVDGLPLEKESLDFLNPADIQSVEVLKDASSTAIYGTRGANGVVIITTKTGRNNEKIQVSYKGYYGIQNPWHEIDMLNKDQYIELINEGRANDDRTPLFEQEMIDTLRWDTDWQDEMYYYNAPKQSHTLSITGGTENSAYSTSLSHLNQDGIVAKGKSNFERVGFRFNSTHDIGIFKFGTNVNFANITKQGIDPNDQFSPYSLIQAMNTPPIIPVTFDNGEWATPEDFKIGLQEITNPTAMLSYLNRKETINKVVGGVFGELEIIRGLILRTHFTTELSYITNDTYTPEYNLDATHISLQNSVHKKIAKYSRWNFDNTLRYSKTISDHSITGMVGLTYFKNWYEDLGAGRSQLIFDDFDRAFLDNGTSASGTPYGGFRENLLASVFGRINYNYYEKYLLEMVLRRDGSSKFGSDYRFGLFPAISAGWVVSKENFFPNQDVLNYAKKRVSWGRNGNDQIADFQYSPTISNDDIYFFGENQDMYYGIRPARIPNSEVRWETSEQLNIGFNTGFLNNKITLNCDFYDKRTKDWLLTPPTMEILGNAPSDENMGEVANKGFEIELGHKNKINNLFYSLSLMSGFNKSEVIRIENPDNSFTGGTAFAQKGDILRVAPGEPLGYFWGYNILGVFQTQEEIDAHVDSEGNLLQTSAKPGDFIFEDRNGDGLFTDDDKINLGNPYPKFNTGINMSLEWKGLDLYMFWYSAIGHKVYLATRRYDVGAVNYSQDDYDNRWTGPGSTNDNPRFSLRDGNKNYSRPSGYFLYDGDYLRLKNLTLGYTIPKELTLRTNIHKVRFYVSTENLLTFTKYPGLEVEVGGEPLNIGIDKGVYPQARTILFGLDITF